MGANQSHNLPLHDDDENEVKTEYEEQKEETFFNATEVSDQESPLSFASVNSSFSTPSSSNEKKQTKHSVFSPSMRNPLKTESPKSLHTVRLYRHSGGVGPNGKWTPVGTPQKWKFAKLTSEEESDDEDDWMARRDKSDGGQPGDWYLVIGDKVQGRVDDMLGIKFNNEQLRVDFVSKGVWAIRFKELSELEEFQTRYSNFLFENTHGYVATEANKVKVLGKDFVDWAEGKDGDEVMWDAEDDSFETGGDKTPKKEADVRETYRGTPRGKGVQSIAMGALNNSYLIHGSGIDIFRNRDQGLEATDLSVLFSNSLSLRGGGGGSTSATPFLTPKKGLLMKGEATMMLMSPSNEGAAHAHGLHQLDIDTGKVVANWQFQKDGTPITMRDITGESKSAQLDSSRSTFLGLDDNRLCRWDMRDRQGLVQDLAFSAESPVLNWSEGHQFAQRTNFQCFATAGSGAIAVGSKDGKVRLYGTTSMRQAKTAFPGLGSPITHIDVTYDGKWIVATTNRFIMVLSTVFKDKDGRQKTGFEGRMGSNIAAPRILKLNPVDAYEAGEKATFQQAQFSWVTEEDRQERHIVTTVGQFSVVWNFRQVKQTDHQCYKDGRGLKTCFCYKIVPKENAIVESRFMHDDFMGMQSPTAPLVVATPDNITSFNV